MDAELNQCWRAGSAPFDGVTISLRNKERIPLSDLRDTLLVVVGALKELWHEARLYRMTDWHEHDGNLSRPEETTWHEVEEMLASDGSLYAARTGDTYVYIGICPSSREFYLRFYLMDSDDPDPFWPREKVGQYGSFDLTCDQSVAQMVMERLSTMRIPELESCSAKEYFDARWAGRNDAS